MMRLWRMLPFAFVVALLALPVLASSVFAAPLAKEVQVSALDYRFDPETVTINAGDTVVWTNNGSATHTVTASDGSWDSGSLAPGQSFSHTFDSAGTVAYYCTFHGSANGDGMAGTVVVQAASAAPAPAPAPTQPTGAEPAFKLGFATLAALIPDVVGQPLENERHNPENGDALQQTTTGLMVWRKADNWTAFTNGYMTWINGPFGLQQRLNSERFDWER